MSNESIASIPADVSDPQVLRRFLLHLVEELDLVLGFRGDDSLVRQSELATTVEGIANSADVTLASVSEGLVQLQEEFALHEAGNDDTVEQLQSQIDALTIRVDDLEDLHPLIP